MCIRDRYKGIDIEKIGLTKYRKNNVSIVFQSYNLITYMNAVQNVINAMEISGIIVPNKKMCIRDSYYYDGFECRDFTSLFKNWKWRY